MGTVITREKVLLVEGKDECNFFEALFEHMGIPDVQLLEVKGKDNLPPEFEAFLVSPGFPNVTKYALIQDADLGREATLVSVQAILNNNRQPCPHAHGEFATDGVRRVGVFIMPGIAEQGMLEDLCMATVGNHPATSCVQSMFDCLQICLEPAPPCGPLEKHKRYMPRNIAKSRAQTFLAAMPEIVSSVGLGAKKGYWDFNHSSMDDLKTFLDDFR